MAFFSLTISTPIALSKPFETPKTLSVMVPCLSYRWKPSPYQLRSNNRVLIGLVAAVPEKLEDKLAESIKQAEELCAGDAVSGECVAAWDEVEELSAAASHSRDKQKNSNPLDSFCKDNPNDEECRIYED